MSTTEKLKALSEALAENCWETGSPLAELRDALPRIVALVEAAQVQTTLPGLYDGLRDALTALDEELEHVSLGTT